MKLKIDTKKLWYLVFAIFLIIILFNVFSYVKPVKSILYKGIAFTFRENIKGTKNIQLLNNETSIYNLFWDNNIKNIKILFQPNVTSMGYYTVEVYELTYKLSSIYKLNKIEKKIVAEPIESYDNISSTNELKIVLIHPDLTNETYVKAENNIIYIAGKNLKDFDLAVIKIILIVMNYKI